MKRDRVWYSDESEAGKMRGMVAHVENQGSGFCRGGGLGKET